MSTVTATSTDVRTLDKELNDQVLAGDILGAFDRFYADDVVMQENTDAPTAGKAVNRAREEQFLASVQEFHGARVLGSAVDGNRSYSEWELDATYKGGARVKLTQVAVREWKNGKVAFERFYYNKG